MTNEELYLSVIDLTKRLATLETDTQELHKFVTTSYDDTKNKFVEAFSAINAVSEALSSNFSDLSDSQQSTLESLYRVASDLKVSFNDLKEDLKGVRASFVNTYPIVKEFRKLEDIFKARYKTLECADDPVEED